MKIKKRISIVADILVDENFDTNCLSICEFVDCGTIHADVFLGRSDDFEVLDYISQKAIELENDIELCNECVYYNGEEDVYHLLDFNPNEISKESLLIEVKCRLMSECHIDPDGIEQAMKSVYLLNVNTLVKVKDEENDNQKTD